MVQIIGYVALAIGFIVVIVSNIIVANKKKKQLMETQNNVEITGRKGFMNDWHIKLKDYFNFSENENAKLESLMDDDAKALVEKVLGNI